MLGAPRSSTPKIGDERMQEQIPDSRPMRVMDWLIVVLFAIAILLPLAILSSSGTRRATWEMAGNALAIIACVVLLSWMYFADGAHSRVWRWLPPFWPWGRHVTAPVGRWCIVLLLILGTLAAIFRI